MRGIVVLIIVLVVGAGLAFSAGPMEATTTDGKRVILHSDGTWTYARDAQSKSEAEGFVKSKEAKERYVSKKGFVEVWYDPRKWKPRPPSNPDAEFHLVHTAGDGYANLIVERLRVPMESLKKAVVDNAKKVSKDLKLTDEQEPTVNGKKLLALKMEGTIQGIPFTQYGYYWSGTAGTVQLFTWCGQNLYSEFSQDFRDLLNGLVINKR